jgi:phenylpyruvate tautomerase PptA (4-oxalocrotonate tautomerase family)/heme-degrading monooxygenase HmoA
MPDVTLSVDSELSQVQKAFIARGIADVIAEHTGLRRQSVQVKMIEVQPSIPAPGAPRRGAGSRRARDADAYVSIRRQYILPDRHEDFLMWFRDSVYPFMASHDGFISSTILSGPDEPDQFVIITKWASVESRVAYSSKPREAELKVESRVMQVRRPTDDFTGHVVGVFR